MVVFITSIFGIYFFTLIFSGVLTLFALMPWLLLIVLFLFFITKAVKGNNARFWLGSKKISFINAISLFCLMYPLISFADWHFLSAYVVGCLLTFSLDIFLYNQFPELFD